MSNPPLLWALLILFILRVAAQLLIAVGLANFLPPWEEWYSGLLPYPWLLASQVLIILVFGSVCLQFSRGHGFFVWPNRALSSGLVAVGAIYLLVMVIRYVIRMSLYPHERWTGGALPIFFHWVLARFLLVLGTYHRRATRNGEHGRSQRVGAIAQVAAWSLVAVGIVAWVAWTA
ncbi:MAG: hypothetical protein HY002_02740 [Candidatus Rokubacteria bacterium]|nr:hypothetical protein [Candidatus Rokubacteria bacterium]